MVTVMIHIFFVLCIYMVIIEYIACDSAAQNFNLNLVQVVFRHGQRTPQRDEMNFVKDINISTVDPWGFGQLTNDGSLQEYKIGEMLRNRYDEFLGSRYHPNHVYAQSTNYDRTKTSLMLVLAALYKPSSELRWINNLQWRPIPIHFLPEKIDNLMTPKTHCNRFEKLLHELVNSEQTNGSIVQYCDLIEYMQEMYPNIKIDMKQIFIIQSMIKERILLNLSLPEWYTSDIMKRLVESSIEYLNLRSYTPEIRRYNGGPLVRRWIENMNVDGKKNTSRKIYLYSGHDVTVYAVAKVHNIVPIGLPTFGSAFILEKYVDNLGNIYVKLFYWNGALEKLESIQLGNNNNSEMFYPIEEYKRLVEESLPTDEDLHCMLVNLTPSDIQNMLITDTEEISF